MPHSIPGTIKRLMPILFQRLVSMQLGKEEEQQPESGPKIPDKEQKSADRGHDGPGHGGLDRGDTGQGGSRQWEKHPINKAEGATAAAAPPKVIEQLAKACYH